MISRTPSSAHKVTAVPATPQSPLSHWQEVLRCPECGGRLNLLNPDTGNGLVCRACAASFPVCSGVPALIRRERLATVEEFSREYEALRLSEGWASPQPGFYQALPFADLTGAHEQEWRQRANSFRQFQRWLRRNFRKSSGAGLRILDAGAGSGWMSRLLAEHHHVVALDTGVGEHGLNAVRADARRYLALQGEFENLPLAAGSFTVVVANASLHHAASLEIWFQQASRVLRLDGWLVVMDSPTYPSEEALSASRERSLSYYEKIGHPHMAARYSGVIETIFAQQEYFDFSCRRPDFSATEHALKRFREVIGYAVGARFPMWVGKRRVAADEFAPRGRYRAGAIIRHNDELLMTVARYQKLEFWHTPGGTLQHGESPQRAVRRRVLIECNLDLEIEGLLGEYMFPAHREWCFVGKPLKTAERELIDEFCRSKVHRRTTLQWLPIDRLAEFDIRPAALKWDILACLKSR